MKQETTTFNNLRPRRATKRGRVKGHIRPPKSEKPNAKSPPQSEFSTSLLPELSFARLGDSAPLRQIRETRSFHPFTFDS
jgi:hypothetical protein